MTDNFSFLKYSVGEQNPRKTLNILSYEIGCVAEHLTIPELRSSANAQVELGDVISMTRMFLEQTGVSDVLRMETQYRTIESGVADLWCKFARLSRCYHYDEVYGKLKHPHGPLSRVVEQFCASQAGICKVVGWDFDEVKALGEEHYLERMTDIKQYGRK